MIYFLFTILNIVIVSASVFEPGLFPLPESVQFLPEEILLDQNFLIKDQSTASHAILINAILRYQKIALTNQGDPGPFPSNTKTLKQLNVVAKRSSALNSTTDESYELHVPTDGTDATLIAETVFGAMHGLETFTQLLRVGGDLGRKASARGAIIKDKPRFAFRGFLTDTARHFLPINVLKQQIDMLSYSKFNVMHWHIVDSQAFPFESKTYPLLAQKGAWKYPSHAYTPAQVAELIQYGLERGVRVVPEFDTPGHTTSWGDGYPELLTQCYDKNGKPNGATGPLNPVNNFTYTFIDNLYKEITSVFHDDFIHMGGDEVPFDCWASNPSVQKFMKQKGYTSFAQLETYYVNHVLNDFRKYKKTPIVWQEVFTNGAKITPDTVVDVWKGHDQGWKQTMADVTAAGHRGILSSPWYLNYIHYGPTWVEYYKQDPHDFNGTQQQKDLVIGGEGCMWGEFVDATNAISRTWPMANAVGERLWSPRSVRDINDAQRRLHMSRCRILVRGINAEPCCGPSYCNIEFGQ